RHFAHATYCEKRLDLLQNILKKSPLGLDFLPIQEFPVNELITQSLGESEISALREQNDVLNQLNEDAIDSMKFEMFEMTAITNAAPGASDGLQIAPGAVIEVQSQ